ncbi:MAG: hypothetical protein ACRDY4_05890 [Acidimicrobiia bacterium]
MRPPLVLALLLAVVLGAACSDGSEPAAEEHLPPNDFEQLADMFGDELEPLGLRLTRGALVDTSDGYEESDRGRHLAVYVEPTAEYSTADYADGIVPSAQVFLPDVFERWDRLETFDVCQEPLPGEDDRKEPPPVTQLYVSRAEADAVDWQTVELAELLEATQPARRDFRLYVSPTIRSDPAFTVTDR